MTGDVIQTIMREEGPMGFFKGLSASYVGCFEGGIQWMAYERLKILLVRRKTAMLQLSSPPPSKSTGGQVPAVNTAAITPIEYFCLAAVSKFLAVVVTYPHEVVRTRLREQAANGAFKYSGFMQTLRTIAKEEGRRWL